jgi:hypothetical protein
MALVLCAPAAAQAFDASFGFYLADRYAYRYFNEATGPRLQHDITLTERFNENWSASLTLWNMQRFQPALSPALFQERSEFIATGAYSGGSLGAGLIGIVYAHETVHWDVGGYAGWTFAAVEDLAMVPVEASAYYDGRGVYGELKVEPSLYLPVSPPVSVTLPVTIGALSPGYGGLAAGGFTGVRVALDAAVLAGENARLGLRGGYFFSFRADLPPYPFIVLSLALNFSTPGSE